MSFLPNDYTAPVTGSDNYMSINKGENRIRILSKPVFGWEVWKDNKPVRFKMEDKPISIDPKAPVRHFWAFIIYNYVEKKIQIFNLTQATLRKKIELLSKDENWGSPFEYDLKIIKTGEDLNTKYDVNPIPHKPISGDIIAAFHAKPCNLEVLFDGLDPFADNWANYTPIEISSPHIVNNKVSEEKKLITPEQVRELNMIIEECEPGYLEKLMGRLEANALKITKFSDLTPALYQAVRVDATNNREAYIKEQQKKFNESVPF